MTFFHPFTHRFSDIERNKVSTLKDCTGHLSILFMTGKHALGEVGVHITDNAAGEHRRAAVFSLGGRPLEAAHEELCPAGPCKIFS